MATDEQKRIAYHKIINHLGRAFDTCNEIDEFKEFPGKEIEELRDKISEWWMEYGKDIF